MKVKPCGDRVLIKIQESENKTAGGIIIPQTAQEKTQNGVVVAVGVEHRRLPKSGDQEPGSVGEVQPGPEIVGGSTRMKAGTAQKLVLNMLSTGTFIRLGYVYGNLMVNVQPKNAKLVDRARGIVARKAGVPYERAAELLAEAGNKVSTAILMGKLAIGREEAERRLAESGGRIRRALGL